MDPQAALMIQEDFLIWSSGFPPESNQQIWVYVEAARPSDTPADEVSQFLLDWMTKEEQSTCQ
jgi:hypothetical protein